MEEEVKNNIVFLFENEELRELLNNMCMGAHEIQMGDLLADMQQKIEEQEEIGTSIEWEEF